MVCNRFNEIFKGLVPALWMLGLWFLSLVQAQEFVGDWRINLGGSGNIQVTRNGSLVTNNSGNLNFAKQISYRGNDNNYQSFLVLESNGNFRPTVPGTGFRITNVQPVFAKLEGDWVQHVDNMAVDIGNQNSNGDLVFSVTYDVYREAALNNHIFTVAINGVVHGDAEYMSVTGNLQINNVGGNVQTQVVNSADHPIFDTEVLLNFMKARSSYTQGPVNNNDYHPNVKLTSMGNGNNGSYFGHNDDMLTKENVLFPPSLVTSIEYGGKEPIYLSNDMEYWSELPAAATVVPAVDIGNVNSVKIISAYSNNMSYSVDISNLSGSLTASDIRGSVNFHKIDDQTDGPDGDNVDAKFGAGVFLRRQNPPGLLPAGFNVSMDFHFRNPPVGMTALMPWPPEVVDVSDCELTFETGLDAPGHLTAHLYLGTSPLQVETMPEEILVHRFDGLPSGSQELTLPMGYPVGMVTNNNQSLYGHVLIETNGNYPLGPNPAEPLGVWFNMPSSECEEFTPIVERRLQILSVENGELLYDVKGRNQFLQEARHMGPGVYMNQSGQRSSSRKLRATE